MHKIPFLQSFPSSYKVLSQQEIDQIITNYNLTSVEQFAKIAVKDYFFKTVPCISENPAVVGDIISYIRVDSQNMSRIIIRQVIK